MSNNLLNGLKSATNYTLTENNGLAHKSTLYPVYDLFALGGSYRKRSDEDCIFLFSKAFKADPVYALKCLFYLRDCRGGAGERRFFRVVSKWLATSHIDALKRNLKWISEFGRWDDLINITYQTALWDDTVKIIKNQIMLDVLDYKEGNGISLLGKWMPSENTSSANTRAMANALRLGLGMSHKDYRKTLSALREHIKVLERLMSAGRWDEIDFSKIPSKAGLVYRNAFARRDIIKEKYEAFVKDENATVNAGTLYPYEVVDKAVKYCGLDGWGWNRQSSTDPVERAAINKYWANIPNVLKDTTLDALCVVDTSGSMTGNSADAPINIAISLGLYCAERAKGPFHNHYISFASRPQLIETAGIDFVDKVKRIYETNLCDNTNLEAAFDLILKTAVSNHCTQNDLPKTILVISDMQIDSAQGWRYSGDTPATMMENMRDKWAAYGYQMPNLVYWNANASRDTFLDDGPNVTYVSGASQNTFKQVMTGKTGIDLMFDTLDSERYDCIK